jgi:ATP-dependent DNA helicase RecG
MTIDELLEALTLGEDRDIEFKAAQGGFPRAVWETVSAFANTAGGIIVLGIAEKNGKFEVVGIRKPSSLIKDFWDTHNSVQKLNYPVCRDSDVSTLTIDGHTVVCIQIPQVSRQQRPIYINANPIGGTYKRNFEGDYRCTEAEVRMMLRDAGDDPTDGKILEGFTVADLDAESLMAYRNRFASLSPDHPFLAKSDRDLLESLGGWRRDRQSKIEGITLAGILMFGKERSILDALPHFYLDYQEQLSNDPEIRWTHRLALDGKWVPNLFNFYYRVYPRLVENIDVPFKLDQTATRLEETHVHEALREALINTLVHADHQISRTITIFHRKDVFIFINPGRLRISREQLYLGGVSDPRNPNLLKMFQMLGLGERAGSGFQKIQRAWQEQHWFRPRVAEHLSLELTGVWLPIVSMISEDIEQEIRSVVGEDYSALNVFERTILMLAHRFGEISNKDIQYYRSEHPRDIGAKLSQFVTTGWLIKRGQGSGTRYQWPIKINQPFSDEWQNNSVPSSHLPPSSEHLPPSSEHLPPSSEHLPSSSEHLPPSSEHLPSSSEHLPPSSEHLPSSSEHLPSSSKHLPSSSEHLDAEQEKKLLQIALPIRNSGKKASKAIMEETILALCATDWLTLRTLARLLDRKPDYLRNHYITQMLNDGRLKSKMPGIPSHPGQAYRKTETSSNEHQSIC